MMILNSLQRLIQWPLARPFPQNKNAIDMQQIQRSYFIALYARLIKDTMIRDVLK